jgi:hypothetical protein
VLPAPRAEVVAPQRVQAPVPARVTAPIPSQADRFAVLVRDEVIAGTRTERLR